MPLNPFHVLSRDFLQSCSGRVGIITKIRACLREVSLSEIVVGSASKVSLSVAPEYTLTTRSLSVSPNVWSPVKPRRHTGVYGARHPDRIRGAGNLCRNEALDREALLIREGFRIETLGLVLGHRTDDVRRPGYCQSRTEWLSYLPHLL